MRDSKAISELRKLGWRILVVWECGFRKPNTNREYVLDVIAERAAAFLNSNRKSRRSGPARPDRTLQAMPCPA